MDEERNNEELEPTESYPIDTKKETIHIPWTMVIIMGVLMAIIIALFVTIMVLDS